MGASYAKALIMVTSYANSGRRGYSRHASCCYHMRGRPTGGSGLAGGGDEAEQGGGVAAEDGGEVSGGEVRGGGPLHRVGDAHVEGVVGAEDYLVRTDDLHQVVQCLRGVDEGVVPVPAQVAARRLRAAAGVGALCSGVVGASYVSGQEAAAVRGEQPQARVPVQGAAEDQVGQRQGGLRRLAEGVAEEVGTEPAAQ